ncbi:uncharacterized protein DS421_13g421040 [Arachis hypogaea]|nr:uncharacterized protein DS421_13g421040 [Arachis hypogaea]
MDGLFRSSSAFRLLSIFHLIHPPDWMFYRSSSHMSKSPETRFNHLFHNGCYSNSLPYIFVPYFIQSHMTTYPSQHLHLCHTQLMFVLPFSRPTLRTIKHSQSYSGAIEFTFKF